MFDFMFKLDFAYASGMTSRAIRASCARIYNVAIGNSDQRSKRSEGNSRMTSVEGTNFRGQSILMHALTAKISRNYFFISVSSIRSFRDVWFIGSLSFSYSKCTVMLFYSPLSLDIMDLEDFYNCTSEL